MQQMPGHPSPDEVYLRVRKRIPSISLATVYKNIRLFLDSGILQEVSPHHGSLRVEMNRHPHHHLVCTRCKRITDIDESSIAELPRRKKLAGGFLVQRYAIDVLGLCVECQADNPSAT
jgi:Fur family peroxide stress response transcriptional regulator